MRSDDLIKIKKLEDKLTSYEDQMKILAGIISDSVSCSTIDKNGNINREWASDNLVKKFGYTFESLDTIEKLSKVIVDEDKEIFANYVENIKINKPVDTQMRIKTSSGGIKWIKIVVEPYTDKKTGEKKLISVFKDITDQKNNEISLKQSEEKYKQLFDNLTLGFAIVEIVYDNNTNQLIDLIIRDTNPAYEILLGFKKQEVLDKSLLQMNSKTDKHLLDFFNKIVLTGISDSIEKHLSHKDMYLNQFVYKIAKNKCGIIFSDITTKKKQEQVLIENELKYRTLFETINQGIVYQDSKGVIISANPAACRILGLTLNEITGRTSANPEWRAIYNDGSPIVPEDHPSMVSLRTGKSVLNKLMGVMNPVENKCRWLLVSALPEFKDGESHPYQVFSSFIDITEQREFEYENKTMLTQLIQAEKLASLGTLTSGIAHEINNPLYFATQYLDIINENISLPTCDINFAEVKDAIKKQNLALNRIKNIVHGMRKLSRKSGAQKEVLDIHSVVEEVVSFVKAIYFQENIEILLNFQATDSKLVGDFGQISQVLLNLLSNAKDAYDKKAENKTITILTSNQNENIVLEIKDNGKGISEANLNKILDPFFTTKDPGKGTGLGLSIVDKIIKEMSGKIDINSTEGIGTTVRCIFPNTEQELQTKKLKFDEVVKLSGTVLVVDDEEDGRVVASRQLKQLGFSVTTASSVDEAIPKIANSKFDYIITDIKMPNIDGIEFIKMLKDNDATKDIKVITLSGTEISESTDAASKSIKNLVFGSLRKPVTSKEIYDLLKPK